MSLFTLMMVSVPMYLLYEVSIWIVSRIGKKQREESVEEVLEKSLDDNPYKCYSVKKEDLS